MLSFEEQAGRIQPRFDHLNGQQLDAGLSHVRSVLGSLLMRDSPDSGYQEATKRYVNTVMDVYFNNPHQKTQMFASYKDVSILLYEEIAELTPYHNASVYRIRDAIKTYDTDDHARALREKRYPTLPRSFCLTMLDSIFAIRNEVTN